MPLADLSEPDSLLDLGRQFEEVDQVAYRRSRQAQPGCQLFLGHAEPIQILLESLGLLNWIEVRPLDVLRQGRFEHLLVVEVHDPYRHFLQTCRLRRPQPALARYQLEALTDRSYHQGLQDAVGPNALAQRGQLILVEVLARL